MLRVSFTLIDAVTRSNKYRVAKPNPGIREQYRQATLTSTVQYTQYLCKVEFSPLDVKVREVQVGLFKLLRPLQGVWHLCDSLQRIPSLTCKCRDVTRTNTDRESELSSEAMGEQSLNVSHTCVEEACCSEVRTGQLYYTLLGGEIVQHSRIHWRAEH